MNIQVRPALHEELEQVNNLRRQVNDFHVAGRPDIFRPGFSLELADHIYEQAAAPENEIVVAVADGVICGFAVVTVVHKPLSPYNNARSFVRIEEFGVDKDYRRMGVATALIEYIKQETKARGYDKLELDVWEFNEGALAFYETAGFKTYRRYMEMDV